MINKIKAIFAAIGSIGVLMFAVSCILWVFTQWPGKVIEFCIVSWFGYWGYRAYKFFLNYFNNESENKQINS